MSYLWLVALPVVGILLAVMAYKIISPQFFYGFTKEFFKDLIKASLPLIPLIKRYVGYSSHTPQEWEAIRNKSTRPFGSGH